MTDPLAETITLNEVLAKRARGSSSETWITLYAKDQIECTLTFGELHAGATAWATSLEEVGVEPGDRVVLVLPTEKAFYEAFWGTVVLGAVPVPAYPPLQLGRLDDYLASLRGIAENSGASALITNDLIRPLIRPIDEVGGQRIPFVLSRNVTPGRKRRNSFAKPKDLALLQYTSGSTGKQKGVMLTHANVLANLRAIGQALQPSHGDVALSWLPLYHDMGLIGLMLGTVYWGIPLVAMSPTDFIRKPSRWLRLMSEHKATFSAAPNFAYNIAALKVKDRDLEGIDLSAWRIAMCGAEPIHASTIASFTRRYQPLGFRPEAFFPAYGLAENTLAVSFSDLSTRPHVEHIDFHILHAQEKAVATPQGQETAAIVSVGRPLETVEVAIMDEDDCALDEGKQGEVVMKGPSVMSGYFNNRKATAETIRQGWLHTGDIGFILDGRLYISGRKKDMVIREGRNYFAEDLEAAVSSVPGVRPGGVCVFATENRLRGSENVVLLAEVAKGAQREGLADKLRKTMAETTGCRPNRVVLVPPRTLPKTSSGKIQRFKARQYYLDGRLEPREREGKIKSLWLYLKARIREMLFLSKRFWLF